jgi:hypothetical protein
MAEVEPLDEVEAAALRRTLRELGQLNRYDEIARDFAERGPAALEELGGKGVLNACKLFDSAHFEVVMAACAKEKAPG